MLYQNLRLPRGFWRPRWGNQLGFAASRPAMVHVFGSKISSDSHRFSSPLPSAIEHNDLHDIVTNTAWPQCHTQSPGISRVVCQNILVYRILIHLYSVSVVCLACKRKSCCMHRHVTLLYFGFLPPSGVKHERSSIAFLSRFSAIVFSGIYDILFCNVYSTTSTLLSRNHEPTTLLL